ncbi:MAG: OmpW/AlkL family protein [Hyphomicrobium sp.]
MKSARLWSGALALLVAFAWAGPATAGDPNGNFMLRVLGAVVDPDTNVGMVTADGEPVDGADADVETEVIPAATLTYFFNKNLALELFCRFANIGIDGEGGLAGTKLGTSWIFPPIVTLQYHFDGMGGFKPYVGAGVQYIHFFDENSNLGGSLDIDDAFGFALQAGVDVSLGDGWYLNADVKKIWMSTDVTWDLGGW